MTGKLLQCKQYVIHIIVFERNVFELSRNNLLRSFISVCSWGNKGLARLMNLLKKMNLLKNVRSPHRAWVCRAGLWLHALCSTQPALLKPFPTWPLSLIERSIRGMINYVLNVYRLRRKYPFFLVTEVTEHTRGLRGPGECWLWSQGR